MFSAVCAKKKNRFSESRVTAQFKWSGNASSEVKVQSCPFMPWRHIGGMKV